MDTGTHSRTNVSQKLEKMEVSPWKESCLGIYKMRDRERPDDRNLTPIKVGIYKMRERPNDWNLTPIKVVYIVRLIMYTKHNYIYLSSGSVNESNDNKIWGSA